MRKSEVIFEKLRKKGEKYVNIKLKDKFIANLYAIDDIEYEYDTIFNVQCDSDNVFEYDYKACGYRRFNVETFVEMNEWEIKVLFKCYLSFNLDISDDQLKELNNLCLSDDISNKVLAANMLYKIKLII